MLINLDYGEENEGVEGWSFREDTGNLLLVSIPRCGVVTISDGCDVFEVVTTDIPKLIKALRLSYNFLVE